ncbi:MAG: YfbU family protein [Planctomycetota bacterium]
MQLTVTERVMLSNQYALLSAVDPDNSAYYDRLQRIVQEGFELHYAEVAEQICKDEDTVSDAQCRFVLDVLSVFDAIDQAVKKHGLPEGVAEHSARFSGFDGNNEHNLMAYAQFYCRGRCHESRFESIIGENFEYNSHCPMTDIYDRMLVVWKGVSAESKHDLSVSQVASICAARTHPDNR